MEKFNQSVRYDKVDTLNDGYNLYRDITTNKYWVGTSGNPRQCWIPGDENVQQVKLTHDASRFCPSVA
jgi:hypothetical protein